jgi:hypothetical protein
MPPHAVLNLPRYANCAKAAKFVHSETLTGSHVDGSGQLPASFVYLSMYENVLRELRRMLLSRKIFCIDI